jgi:microcystin-dependent protein
MYGGDGKSNFKLPNLQAAVPIGMGQGTGLNLYAQGETGGEQSVTLQIAQTPAHTHAAKASPGRGATTPVGNSFGDSTAGNFYSGTTSPLVAMSPTAVSVSGGGQAHNNIMPFLGLYWIIALQGIFPPRS